jgi:hypothetical protein
MSVDQAFSTDAVVFVRLLDEGVDVWRPVPAAALSDGTFRLGQPNDYDPETEHWEFPPHTRVRCQTTRFAGGKEGLVAVQAAA